MNVNYNQPLTPAQVEHQRKRRLRQQIQRNLESLNLTLTSNKDYIQALKKQLKKQLKQRNQFEKELEQVEKELGVKNYER